MVAHLQGVGRHSDDPWAVIRGVHLLDEGGRLQPVHLHRSANDMRRPMLITLGNFAKDGFGNHEVKCLPSEFALPVSTTGRAHLRHVDVQQDDVENCGAHGGQHCRPRVHHLHLRMQSLLGNLHPRWP